MAASQRGTRTRGAWWGLAVYFALLTTVAVIAAALVHSAEDAPIGGAALLAGVGLLGLPWSLAIFLWDDGLSRNVFSVFLYTATAMLNGTLLTWLGVSIRRRSVAR